MRVSEQLSKKFKRTYFHGYRAWHDKNLRICKEFYLTTSFVYACIYAGENGTVDSFKLSEDLDIFNANSEKDFSLLKNYLEKYRKDLLQYLPRLKKEDWTLGDIFDTKIRNDLIEILKALKFDGFFNYEVDKNLLKFYMEKGYGEQVNPVMIENPSIGIFDENNLLKIDSKKGTGEFEEEKSYQEFKEKEKDFIKYRILKLYDEGKYTFMDVAHEIISLNKRLFCFDEEEIEALVCEWDIDELAKDREKFFKAFNYLEEKIIKRWPVITDYYTEGYHLIEKICHKNIQKSLY